MDPDQTAQEQSDLRLPCLLERLLKHFSRQILVVIMTSEAMRVIGCMLWGVSSIASKNIS